MRRTLTLTPILVLLLVLLSAGNAVAAPAGLPEIGKVYTGTSPGRTPAHLKATYVVTRIIGPYNGRAKDGDPGFPQSDGEADTVQCRNNGDGLLTGSATVLRKTDRGISRHDVLNVSVIGAFWNSEVDRLQWGAFFSPNGNEGWNSIQLKITCLG